MILDASLQFDTAVSLAIAVGTQPSTNAIDWGLIGGLPTASTTSNVRDMGIGDDPALKLLVQVSTTFTSGGAGTLSVTVQGAPDAAANTPGVYVSWYTSPVYALGTLTAGERLMDMDFPRPPAGVAIPRYVRLLYTVAGATITAGNVTSYIVLDRDDAIYSSTNNATMGGYAAGITVAN